MKPFLKRAAISLLIGVVLTFGVGGTKYLVLDKPGFDPRGSCGSDPLCDPSPYLNIGVPWTFGNYSDADGTTTILNSRDGELTGRYYRGLVANTILYGLLTFALLIVVGRVHKKP